MKKPVKDIIQFLGRYSVFAVVPGMWFAYVGGIAPWIGGIAGLCAAALIALPALIVARRAELPATDPIEDCLR